MGAFASGITYGPTTAGFLRDIRRYTLIINIIGVLAVASCPFWLGALFFTSPRDYSYTSSLICVPLVAIACYAGVAHVAQRNAYLKRLMSAGLVAHMAASSIFLWMGFYFYGASVDAFHYWTVGGELTRDFSVVGWSAFHPPYWSTNLINNISGIMMLLIGDGLPTLFITFALAAFWGAFFFYRAFEIAFPEGDKWLFGLLIFLSPSILFWSSSLGKDALAQLFVGLTCYGFARLNHRAGVKGILLCAVGLGGVLLVRAHVAAMLAMGMTFPYALGKSKGKGANKIVKVLIIPILLGGTYFLVTQAGRFLGVESTNAAGGIEKVNTLTKNNQVGGGSFNEESSLPIRIAESPFLIFRPFPWEVHGAMDAAASIESTGWLLLCFSRRRVIWFALKHWRDPYIGFILTYSVIFSVVFAAASSNFGIVVRQRIMMVPLALMLICVGKKRAIMHSRRAFKRHLVGQQSISLANPD